MALNTDTELDVKLAVYMERLDSYIDSQTKLNESICQRVDELKHWRTKIYGVKSSVVVLSLIMMHTGVILGSVFAMMNWFSNR